MRLRIAAAAVAALAVLPPSADGAAPVLDPSFGSGGVSRTVAGTGDASLSAIDVAPDGTILGAGTANVDDVSRRAFVARWLPNGAVDPGFGVRLFMPLPATPSPDNPGGSGFGLAVAATPSSGAVLGGRYQDSSNRRGAILASYGSDGELVSSFGGSGYVTWPFVTVSDVLRRADGRILAGVTFLGPPGAFWQMRQYTTAGQPDTTFDEDGEARYPWFKDGRQDWLRDLEPQGTDTVAVGDAAVEEVELESGARTERDAMAAQRVDESGALDPSFGTGGRTLVDFGGLRASASAVVTAPDGGLVLAGHLEKTAGDYVWALTKLDSAGNVVPAFGTGGKVVLPLNGAASDVAVDAAGNLLVAGTADQRFTVIRLTADGARDTDFGVFQPIAGSSGAGDIEMLADGAALISGSSVENDRFVPTIVKLAPAPAGDPDDGDDGSGGGTTSGGGSGSSNGGGASGSAPSTGGGIPTRIVGPLRGLKLQMLGKRPVRGALRFRVGWAEGSRGRGELKVHATRRGKRVLVASLRFTISGGTGATLRVPLTVSGRRIFGAVRKNGRTPVRATLTTTPTP